MNAVAVDGRSTISQKGISARNAELICDEI